MGLIALAMYGGVASRADLHLHPYFMCMSNECSVENALTINAQR